MSEEVKIQILFCHFDPLSSEGLATKIFLAPLRLDAENVSFAYRNYFRVLTAPFTFMCMENQNATEGKYNEAYRDIKTYVDLQLDLLRLEVVEKGSKLVSGLLVLVIVLFMVFGALIYLSVALLSHLESLFGSMIPGCLMISGGLLLMTLVVIRFKKYLFLNPLIRLFASLILDEESKEVRK